MYRVHRLFGLSVLLAVIFTTSSALGAGFGLYEGSARGSAPLIGPRAMLVIPLV